MRLYRFLSAARQFNGWTEASPEQQRLLDSIMGREQPDEDGTYRSVSVYRADCWNEELENAAAYRSDVPKKVPERAFAVAFDSRDLASAGVSCKNTTTGTPGIQSVDSRHFELAGTRDQFLRLLENTVKRYAEDESVIRVYSREHIRIQLEAFAFDPEVRLTPNKGARKRIHRALGQDVDLDALRAKFDPHFATVEIATGHEPIVLQVARPR